MTRLAVFDCDGTLVDGQADVCEAMERAFGAIEAPPPPRNEIRRIVGLSLPNAVRQLMTDEDRDEAQLMQVVEAYKHNFRERRTSGVLHEPLFEGMAELLHRLHDDGWQLAVATGKSERGLHACLEAHGIKGLFVSLQAADGHPSKPHPAMLEAALFEAGTAPEHAVMIGDTSFDMLMAREAGVRGIGVAWGYHEASELIECGAEAVAETVTELETLL